MICFSLVRILYLLEYLQKYCTVLFPQIRFSLLWYITLVVFLFWVFLVFLFVCFCLYSVANPKSFLIFSSLAVNITPLYHFHEAVVISSVLDICKCLHAGQLSYYIPGSICQHNKEGLPQKLWAKGKGRGRSHWCQMFNQIEQLQSPWDWDCPGIQLKQEKWKVMSNIWKSQKVSKQECISISKMGIKGKIPLQRELLRRRKPTL